MSDRFERWLRFCDKFFGYRPSGRRLSGWFVAAHFITAYVCVVAFMLERETSRVMLLLSGVNVGLTHHLYGSYRRWQMRQRDRREHAQ